MTVAPHKRRFSVSVVTRQRKHPYPFREATSCVNASQCMASHGQNSHGCSLPFCSQQCEHIVSSVSLSGDCIVPPSIVIHCGVFRYCFERIAPPYAAMASGLVSTIAFVVNLPMLRPGTILHEALVADGFPVDTSLDVSTWLEEATRLTHRDLPEFVPITSTATEELTEHTQIRVNHRVYIINDVAMPSQFHLPFVIH